MFVVNPVERMGLPDNDSTVSDLENGKSGNGSDGTRREKCSLGDHASTIIRPLVWNIHEHIKDR
jgi:hypothetical protein